MNLCVALEVACRASQNSIGKGCCENGYGSFWFPQFQLSSLQLSLDTSGSLSLDTSGSLTLAGLAV